jgi:hypothetical protein
VEGMSNDIAVAANTITAVNHGIRLWALTGFNLRNVSISGNVLSVAQKTYGSMSHSGIAFVRDSAKGTLDGAFDGVVISGNAIAFDRATPAASYAYADSGGILVYPQGSVRNVILLGNVIRNAPTQAIRLQSGHGDVSGAVVAANLITDAGLDPRSSVRVGIGLFGRVRDTRVDGNSVGAAEGGVAIVTRLDPSSAVMVEGRLAQSAR